jgi:hypothetical protein
LWNSSLKVPRDPFDRKINGILYAVHDATIETIVAFYRFPKLATVFFSMVQITFGMFAKDKARRAMIFKKFPWIPADIVDNDVIQAFLLDYRTINQMAYRSNEPRQVVDESVEQDSARPHLPPLYRTQPIATVLADFR